MLSSVSPYSSIPHSNHTSFPRIIQNYVRMSRAVYRVLHHSGHACVTPCYTTRFATMMHAYSNTRCRPRRMPQPRPHVHKHRSSCHIAHRALTHVADTHVAPRSTAQISHRFHTAHHTYKHCQRPHSTHTQGIRHTKYDNITNTRELSKTRYVTYTTNTEFSKNSLFDVYDK